jgi:hypothetical protein
MSKMCLIYSTCWRFELNMSFYEYKLYKLGCPHMTCSSCSCEFCYLCGRRYVKFPVIGQHNNKFRFVCLLFLI